MPSLTTLLVTPLFTRILTTPLAVRSLIFLVSSSKKIIWLNGTPLSRFMLLKWVTLQPGNICLWLKYWLQSNNFNSSSASSTAPVLNCKLSVWELTIACMIVDSVRTAKRFPMCIPKKSKSAALRAPLGNIWLDGCRHRRFSRFWAEWIHDQLIRRPFGSTLTDRDERAVRRECPPKTATECSLHSDEDSRFNQIINQTSEANPSFGGIGGHQWVTESDHQRQSAIANTYLSQRQSLWDCWHALWGNPCLKSWSQIQNKSVNQLTQWLPHFDSHYVKAVTFCVTTGLTLVWNRHKFDSEAAKSHRKGIHSMSCCFCRKTWVRTSDSQSLRANRWHSIASIRESSARFEFRKVLNDWPEFGPILSYITKISRK